MVVAGSVSKSIVEIECATKSRLGAVGRPSDIFIWDREAETEEWSNPKHDTHNKSHLRRGHFSADRLGLFFVAVVVSVVLGCLCVVWIGTLL